MLKVRVFCCARALSLAHAAGAFANLAWARCSSFLASCVMILVTGGAGFIGANFIHHWRSLRSEPVTILDALTYAANPATLADLTGLGDVQLVHADIGDRAVVESVLATYRPRAIVHLAAETHVDRSILGPEAFVQSNVVGTQRLLESTRAYWVGLTPAERSAFRFLHVSTDEVYGSLAPDDPPAHECSPFRPNSPYAASKAAAEHFVRAYGQTYGLPVLVVRSSNNFGPYQFPEKLIPLIIRRALDGVSLPLYGDGQQVRDWLYVTDHCEALVRVLEAGEPHAIYNVGAGAQLTNRVVVQRLCALLDERRPRPDGRSYTEQVEFVPDRPGHDRRYALNTSRICRALGWRARTAFDEGLRATVDWYLGRHDWLERTGRQSYHHWPVALPDAGASGGGPGSAADRT